MNHTKISQSKLGLALLCVPLVFLPGCEWFGSLFGSKKKESTEQAIPAADQGGDYSVTLASMNGKPLITEASLNKDFEQLLNENPQLKQVLPLMPTAKHDFLVGMVSQAIVDKYVEDQGIDKKAEYQTELASTMKSVKRMLNTKYFGMANPVEVTDAEVKKFYDDNKEAMPDLLVSRGGVKAIGISFNKEADAKAFLAKVKGNNFNKVAAEAGLKDKIHDFKLVNDQSLGLDAGVRSKVTSMKKFPAVELVKGNDNTYWVVQGTESEAPKYRPFDQIKAGLKQFVEKEKRMEMYDKEINKLKTQYNVVINEDYFGKQDKAGAVEQQVGAQIPPQTKMAEAEASTPKAARTA